MFPYGDKRLQQQIKALLMRKPSHGEEMRAGTGPLDLLVVL